jgi:tRNA nucleotidyltransferase (CCA-adding enzyme)
MVRVPKRFVEETLWPEFEELNRTLHAYLDEVTERVIREEIDRDSSEAAIKFELTGGEAATVVVQADHKLFS